MKKPPKREGDSKGSSGTDTTAGATEAGTIVLSTGAAAAETVARVDLIGGVGTCFVGVAVTVGAGAATGFVSTAGVACTGTGFAGKVLPRTREN